MMSAATLVQAQILPSCGGPDNPCKICHLFLLINNIIKVVIMGLVPVAAGLVIAIAGIRMMLDRENAEVFEESKHILLMVIIGLVLIYGAYALVNTMFAAMGYANPNPLRFDNVNCPSS